MLDELCSKISNIIAVQEHWLRSDELDKFNIINADFNYHAVSAMDIAVSLGILKGRPFGGVGFLWRKCFDSNIQVLSNDPADGCLVIKLNINSRSILLFNMYFSCFEPGADYRSEITYYMGFIENILDTVSHTDVVILGDTNFPLNSSNPGFVVMNSSLSNCITFRLVMTYYLALIRLPT